MQLDFADGARLVRGMHESFTRQELAMLLAARFGLNFDDVAAPDHADPYRAHLLHKYFHQRYETEQLIAAVRDARPKVPVFLELADKAGMTRLGAGVLQVVITPGSAADGSYLEPARFRRELAACEDAICRVEVLGGGFGTGTLVGPDLVLTNYHVVETALAEDQSLQGVIRCRFDHRQTSGGYTTPPRVETVVAVPAASAYSPEDFIPDGPEGSPQQLDYALLKLPVEISRLPIVDGGDPRGHVKVAAEPAVPALNSAILILQHPAAEPLLMDLGIVTRLSTTRLRHNVNTECGSSGAPLFDRKLGLIGLHHAGHEWPSIPNPYNQAIPIVWIAADARRRGTGL